MKKIFLISLSLVGLVACVQKIERSPQQITGEIGKGLKVEFSKMDSTLRADKATYFTLQRRNTLPIAVEFNHAGDYPTGIDTLEEAQLLADYIDNQFINIYKAQRLNDQAIAALTQACFKGTVADVVQAARANYKFRD